MTSSATMTKLVVALTGGFLVGAAPFLMWIGTVRVGRGPLLATAGAGALALSALGVWQTRAEIGRAPRRLWEFGLAGVSVSGYPAVAGAIAAAVYLGVYWLVRAGNAALDTTWSEQAAPFWSALGFFAFFGAAMWLTVPRSTIRRMYPDPRARTGSSLFASALGRVDRDMAMGLLGALLFGAVAAFFSSAAGVYVGATMLVVVLANVATPRQRIETAASPDEVTAIVDTVAESFTAAGFESVPFPTTGDPAVDPLLASVHLVAFADECALAVEVIVGVPGARVERDQIDPIVHAAWALEGKLEGVGRVWPVLVLVDVAVDGAARHHAVERQVSLLGTHGRARIEEHLLCGERLRMVEAGLSDLAPTSEAAG